MRMLPIKYRACYCSERPYEPYEDGFDPIRTEDEIVWSRNVEIVPTQWNKGVYLSVSIIDEVANRKTGELFERLVHKFTIYDNEDNMAPIKPTFAQAQLMHALYRGDIRGDYAESVVNSLYIDLIVFNPRSKMNEFLPNVCDFFQRINSMRKG